MTFLHEILKTTVAINAQLREMRQNSSPAKSDSTGSSSGSGLDPHVVAKALAEAMKHDNATTQAIAVRAANLQNKYPSRAY